MSLVIDRLLNNPMRGREFVVTRPGVKKRTRPQYWLVAGSRSKADISFSAELTVADVLCPAPGSD